MFSLIGLYCPLVLLDAHDAGRAVPLVGQQLILRVDNNCTFPWFEAENRHEH